MRRRTFSAALLAGLGIAATPVPLRAALTPSPRPLDLLILGGTGFLGPATVDHALARGHRVTLFNRGKTNADLFPQLETIIGDRDPDVGAGLNGLAGRQWDAVIDNSGYLPRTVAASSRLLAPNVGQYLFVSTICQYDNWLEGPPGGTEDRPRATLEDPASEDITAHYCELKAYCERAAEAALPGRVTHMRPGLIVGPRDRSDRFTYWPVRMARGGEVLAPGKPSDRTQYIDVRDLAAFMVHCVERGLTGPFNAVRMPLPFGEFLRGCREAINPDAALTWVPSDFLAGQDVRPWRDLHLWVDADGPQAGSLAWSSQKAIDAGLTFRPLAATARDTLAWFRTLPAERQAVLRAGLDAEREAAVLAAWQAHQSVT
ncbi:MAG: NAD-dependent epimerase/dehydratase family protein [Xanthomonadales bacterium]